MKIHLKKKDKIEKQKPKKVRLNLKKENQFKKNPKKS